MGTADASELVGVAFANDLFEAEMIRELLNGAGIPSVLQQVGVDGALLGFGLPSPGGTSQRVMVRADQAEAARTLLAETLVQGEEVDWDETANARHLEEAEGRKPRSYGLFGAYARIWALSVGAMGLAFAVFLLLRAT